jgi:hypothetical protein
MSEIAMNYGFYSNQWRKLPFLFGVSSTFLQQFSLLNAPAGNTIASSTPVPASQIHILIFLSAADNTSPFGPMSFDITRSGFVHVFASFPTVVAAKFEVFTGNIVLMPGDFLRVSFNGVTAGDHLQANFHGFVMEISE